MKKYRTYLEWVSSQEKSCIALLEKWTNINSSSFHLEGLKNMCQELISSFSILGGKITLIPIKNTLYIGKRGEKLALPHGDLLSIRKREKAPIQILFGGHMDTVFPKDTAFQKVERIDHMHLKGPGVADMKGGLIVLLTVLQAFEQTAFAEKIGWEIFINADEELGSIGSKEWIVKKAKEFQLGLLFEPSFPDGALVSKRKGSENYTLFVKGKPAHVGRDFTKGKSAIYALSRLIVQIEQLAKDHADAIVNVGLIEGGDAINIVPEFASCKVNIRADQQPILHTLRENILALIKKENESEDIEIKLHIDSQRPAKPFGQKTEKLFHQLDACAQELGEKLFCIPTGGVCDGNLLEAAGLPNIDTLGVIGGKIHTDEEYMVIDSLCMRAKLVLLFLMRLAEGEFS